MKLGISRTVVDTVTVEVAKEDRLPGALAAVAAALRAEGAHASIDRNNRVVFSANQLSLPDDNGGLRFPRLMGVSSGSVALTARDGKVEFTWKIRHSLLPLTSVFVPIALLLLDTWQGAVFMGFVAAIAVVLAYGTWRIRGLARKVTLRSFTDAMRAASPQ